MYYNKTSNDYLPLSSWEIFSWYYIHSYMILVFVMEVAQMAQYSIECILEGKWFYNMRYYLLISPDVSLSVTYIHISKKISKLQRQRVCFIIAETFTSELQRLEICTW